MSRHMSLLLLFALLAAPPAATAQPLPSCADIAAILPDTDTTTATAPLLTGAESCFFSRALSGAQSYHCTWEFPYRDPAIPATFDAFATQLQTCLPDLEPTGTDQDVNHPDTYDQRRFRAGDTAVTLAIKDKSARQKTFIFLGIVPDR